ncbi:hypothetical protein P1P75_25435 [Streptomyces sp. ID05-39B]|uniref:hypothetical protein n=1 Tax=Streptomyces sp. ID05-39B TaxID=3028664 RepID=UPI0029B84A16|nr:hypothetical protein [Streptomyces sp. ID05-39B]MDX3529664.1 hypothetical protein [Streptomyces sp. ID05-39B]
MTVRPGPCVDVGEAPVEADQDRPSSHAYQMVVDGSDMPLLLGEPGWYAAPSARQAGGWSSKLAK